MVLDIVVCFWDGVLNQEFYYFIFEVLWEVVNKGKFYVFLLYIYFFKMVGMLIVFYFLFCLIWFRIKVNK